MSPATEMDVLIAGAGPAGLFAALCLTRLGIRVKIVEQRILGETAGQADGIQSRTQEMWDSLGTGEKLRELGRVVTEMATYGPNKEQTGIEAGGTTPNVLVASARYQYELILHTKHIEEIIRDALSDAKVYVDQPCVLSNLEIIEGDDYSVKVQCVHFNKERLAASGLPSYAREKAASDEFLVDRIETIHARYLIGCDGAHSWVRRQCKIAMEGTMPGYTYGVIDFTPVTDFPTFHAKNLIQSPSGGLLGVIPKPNNTARLYISLRDPAVIEDLDKSSEKERIEKLSQFISAEFSPYDMRVENVTWCNTYKVSRRIASRYSHKGCVFIAGDACHTHSANAGQGANVSMTDSYNISWKLAHVIRGWADVSILDTYELERRPYSLELLEFDREIEKLLSPNSLMPEEYAQLWNRQLQFVTGLGLRYNSRLVVSERFQEIIPGVTIGRRFPPAEVIHHSAWKPYNTLDIIGYSMKFKLVLFTGDIARPSMIQVCADFINDLGKLPHFWEMTQLVVIMSIKKKEATATHIQITDDIDRDYIFIDDGIQSAQKLGPVHEGFGVSPNVGAAVLVRPDGHVAMIVPPSKDKTHFLKHYLLSL